MKLEFITFQDWRKMKFDKKDVVITVSKSTNWSKGLSPVLAMMLEESTRLEKAIHLL